MSLIECRDLSVRYSKTIALSDVSLKFDEGSWTTVIGPSGGGKTTLLRAIAGLEPLAEGEIKIAEALASNRRIMLSPHERRIGFLFQESSLWPHLSAAANVALGIADASLSRRAKFQQANQWLERLGLTGMGNKFAGELSGGEAQRVALARALASRPRVLLLDEPTAHLDLHLREGLMAQLHKLHADEKLTTICVMHQFEPPLQSSDRIVILEKRGIHFDGPFSAIPQSPETPFTLALRRYVARVENWAI